ncbi:MAG: TIGR03915 family putative DNA repair protein [Prevotellaceae bacterium]|jgi:probable DNA metabolism protein|nr:TIGR03915 family putative DNA repair protein [Prevotellaceae bacterium]
MKIAKEIDRQGNIIYIYDGTFDGFLTVVFEVYASKQKPLQIVSRLCWEPNFFDVNKQVATDKLKSERVWKGILARSNANVANMLYLSFASEIKGIEDEMYRYLEKLFADTTACYYQNLLDENSFTLYKVAHKVNYEIQRFKGFVRFQETADGMFFSIIGPDHDIVSLLAPHFTARYPDRPWIIYDNKRDKGVYFDTSEMIGMTLTDKQFDEYTGNLNNAVKSEKEDYYQQLWKIFYKAINIKERKNTRLLLHWLPRRYWRYLPERS